MAPGMGGSPPGRRRPGDFVPQRNEEPAGELDLEKLEQQSRDMMELHMLNRDNAEFRENSGGFLDLSYNGRVYEDVQVVRMFPFSRPDEYLSVRESGDQAAEIGVIENLPRDFDGPGEEAVRHQLALRYFLPAIRKIYNVRQEMGCVYFDVETDYGRCQFAFRSNSNAVTRISESRVMIQDLDNNCFEIPDIRKLTAGEQKKLDVYLT